MIVEGRDMECCVHRWYIWIENGQEVGRCKLCGERKVFREIKPDFNRHTGFHPDVKVVLPEGCDRVFSIYEG